MEALLTIKIAYVIWYQYLCNVWSGEAWDLVPRFKHNLMQDVVVAILDIKVDEA